MNISEVVGDRRVGIIEPEIPVYDPESHRRSLNMITALVPEPDRQQVVIQVFEPGMELRPAVVRKNSVRRDYKASPQPFLLSQVGSSEPELERRIELFLHELCLRTEIQHRCSEGQPLDLRFVGDPDVDRISGG